MRDKFFSDWLDLEMRYRDIGQRQLAKLSGVDHSAISRILRGKHEPLLETAQKLMDALGYELVIEHKK